MPDVSDCRVNTDPQGCPRHIDRNLRSHLRAKGNLLVLRRKWGNHPIQNYLHTHSIPPTFYELSTSKPCSCTSYLFGLFCTKKVRATNFLDALQARVAFLTVDTTKNLPSVPPRSKQRFNSLRGRKQQTRKSIFQWTDLRGNRPETKFFQNSNTRASC